MMRRFGRQCRGQGHVFVKLVRQTELLLLECGQPINTLGQQGQRLLALASHLRPTKRERLASELNAAMDAHTHIRTQSIRLTQGKKLSHCKIVNAYDPTIAPILKGKSNCPAQFGRKPGLVSEPATGFIFANRVPEGNPCDASYVLPLLDKVQGAIERVRTAPRRQSIRWRVISASMMRRCGRRSINAGYSRLASPRPLSPFSRIPVLRKSTTSSLRRACTASAPRTKCTWPVPVAIAARSWKATSPACFHAVRARYVTRVL